MPEQQSLIFQASSSLAVVSLIDARAANLKRYYLGIPCANGHDSERRVSDQVCLACEREKAKRYFSTAKGQLSLRGRNERAKPRKLQWTKTPQGRIACNRNNKTAKGKASRKRFDQTPKGKACATRAQHYRRARKRGQTCVRYSHQDLLRRYALFDNKCAYCGAGGQLSEDHFVPLKRNGGHRIENIVPACLSCNTRKNAMDPEKWYRNQPFFSEARWLAIIRCVNLVKLEAAA